MSNSLRLVFGPALERDLATYVESVAQRVWSQRPSPYMTTEEAAAYLRCDRGRIHDLTRLGRLTRHKEGRRVLLLREEVEALVARS